MSIAKAITIEEIKKERKYVDFLCEIFYSRLIEGVAYILYRMKFTPNLVTLTSFFLTVLASIVMFSSNTITLSNGILYFILVQMSFVLDCSDGIIARVSGRASNFGAWFDAVKDRFGEVLLLFSVVFYFYAQSGSMWLFVLVYFASTSHLLEAYSSAFYSRYYSGGIRNNKAVNNRNFQNKVIWLVNKFEVVHLLKGLTITNLLLSIVPLFNNGTVVYVYLVYLIVINFFPLLLKMLYFWRQSREMDY